jgi:ABC-2 type transport system permease protein
MRPLMFFGVIYVVFTQIFSFGNGVPHYGVYLLTGIVLWTYFGEATAGAVQCLLQREALLRKVRFPRMVVPLSVALTALFNLGMNSIAVIVFALANGISPTLSWLWMIPIVLGFVVLATGTGMLLSALFVRYRDVAPIWDVLVQLLFYASPVMYVAGRYHGAEHIAMLSPFAMLLTQMGHAFIDPNLPSAARAAGGGARLLIPITIIIGTFALGWWVFTQRNRSQARRCGPGPPAERWAPGRMAQKPERPVRPAGGGACVDPPRHEVQPRDQRECDRQESASEPRTESHVRMAEQLAGKQR